MFRPFVLIFLVFTLAGCASILSSSEQEVSVNSNVQGASISLNGQKIGVTPFIGKIPRQSASDGARISLSKEGYVTQTNILSSDGVNPVFWVNALITIGSTTDFATGAMWQISPSNIYIEMQRKESSRKELKKHKKSVEIKDFIFKNYHHLANESSRPKEGAYFRSLHLICSTLSWDEIEQVFRETQEPVSFAEKLVSRVLI